MSILRDINAYLNEIATPQLDWKTTKVSRFGWSRRSATTAHGTYHHEVHPIFGHFVRYQTKGSSIAPRIRVKNQDHAEHVTQVHHWNAYKRDARVVSDRGTTKTRAGASTYEIGNKAAAHGNVGPVKGTSSRTGVVSGTKAPVGSFHTLTHSTASSEKQSVERAKKYLGKPKLTKWQKYRERATAYLGKHRTW